MNQNQADLDAARRNARAVAACEDARAALMKAVGDAIAADGSYAAALAKAVAAHATNATDAAAYTVAVDAAYAAADAVAVVYAAALKYFRATEEAEHPPSP